MAVPFSRIFVTSSPPAADLFTGGEKGPRRAGKVGKKMKFQAEEVAMEMLIEIGPLLEELKRRDRGLEDQARRAAQSVALNVSEGNRREGKDRNAHFRIAAGSAAETRTAIKIALAWRYVEVARAERVDTLLDRELA